MIQSELINRFSDLSSGFSIEERISLNNVWELFQTAEEKLLGWAGALSNNGPISAALPDHLPWGDQIGLDYLEYTPTTDEEPSQLFFRLSWPDAHWEIFPGIFSIEEFDLQFIIIDGNVMIIAEGFAFLEGCQLFLSLELPTFMVRAQLSKPNAQSPSPARLMNRFTSFLGPSTHSVGGLQLYDLSLVANPRGKTFFFNLEFGDLTIGKVVIDGQMQVNYNSGAISGFCWADFAFSINGEDYLIALKAAHDGPGSGWQLEGGAVFEDLTLFDLYEALKAKFGISQDLPAGLNGSNTKINYIHLSVNTHTKNFTFSLAAKFSIGSKELDSIFNIEVTHQNEKTTRKFSGFARVGDLDFDLIFQQEEGGHTMFLGAYHQEGAVNKLNISGLLEPIGVENAPEMNISINDAFFVNDKTDQKSYNLLVADVGAGMNLSNLPLVGKVLPADATLSLALRVLYASAPYARGVEAVNQLLPEGIAKISKPEQEDKEGFDLIAELKIGKQKFYLGLPVEIKKKAGSDDHEIKEKESALTNPPAVAASNQDDSPVPVNDGITWFKIGKTFGPVTFNRIGLTFKDSLLSVYPDASLSMGGLVFTLNELSVSSPITEFKPKFHLKGLGLDFKNGDLEIGATFIRRQIEKEINGVTEKIDEYDGIAIIKTAKLSISALGSYCYLDGHHSLFIYAYLNQALGGPSFFFVEGLAAAFGYNRALIMPEIDQISTFPLVAQVMKGDDPTAGKDRATLLTQQLDAISKYVPPAPGQLFFAVGVKFNSFKLIDSFVLLAVEFGKHTEVVVLGQSNIVVPSVRPPGKPPLAEIKIQLLARYLPDEGCLAVRAELTKDSYIFSKDCHLSGGAAFYSWFKGEHEGDFVVTLGGYHPGFNVPAHYPQVPRLALNWQVSDHLSVKGDMYFALCAHAFMAGGHLEALYSNGSLKAWFREGADFLITWQPYHYDASMYIDIGASYTYHFFGTHHISVHVGADLHIWGPEFAGKARIKVGPCHVTVRFGPQGNSGPKPISWADFKTKCLPEEDQIISAAITQGKHNEDDAQAPIVNPNELTIAVHSVVPVNSFDTPAEEQPEGKTFGIAPMNMQGITSSIQTIKITKGNNEDLTADEKANFIFTPVSKKVPAALWGNTFAPDLNAPERTVEGITGVIITTKEPIEHGGIDFKSLDDLLDDAFDPLSFSDRIPDHTITKELDPDKIRRCKTENQIYQDLRADLELEDMSIMTYN